MLVFIILSFIVLFFVCACILAGEYDRNFGEDIYDVKDGK